MDKMCGIRRAAAAAAGDNSSAKRKCTGYAYTTLQATVNPFCITRTLLAGNHM